MGKQPFRQQGPARTYLSVGSRASQLILPLLVVGLSLAPSLAALVPVVPRDACVWKRGRKLELLELGAEGSAAPDLTRLAGRTLSSPRLASPLLSQQCAALPKCHHTRAAQP